MTFNFTKPLLILAAILFLFGVVVASSYAPQDFAQANNINAQQTEDVRHAAQMHALTEQDTADLNAQTAARRTAWTETIVRSAFAALVVIVLLVGTATPVAIAYSARWSAEFTMLGVQRVREIKNRPALTELPTGQTFLETRMGKVLLFDKTGRATLLEATPANPELVQVVMAQIAAQVAIEQSKHAPKGKMEILQ